MNRNTDRQLKDLQTTVAITTPPTKSTASRDAVSSIVDGVLAEASKSMKELRKGLDTVESLMLENAAHIKGELQEHVDLSTRILEESERVGELVSELKDQQERRLRRSGD